jgi:hypothetical protein
MARLRSGLLRVQRFLAVPGRAAHATALVGLLHV